MVWIKSRQQTDGSTSPIGEHGLWDTLRGAGTSGTANKAISSNATSAEGLGWTDADYISSFGTNGFTVQNGGGTTTHRIANHAFQNYASWTFRKQPKFFDVVTYTGDGVSGRTISHNLGSAPGCIIIKSTSTAGEYWSVYHRSLGATKYLWLQDTMAASTSSTYWNDTSPTSSVFSVGTDGSVNGNGKTYVAYLFAHNAGGFGATGADNVISCGSYTTDGSGNGTLQNIGFEPQWVLVKASTGTAEDWVINDSMRGMFAAPAGSAYALRPNLTNAENLYGLGVNISSNGFTGFGSASRTYIYIAIRRGPMKTPTTGTSVFSPSTYVGGSTTTISFPPDLVIQKARNTLNPGTDAEAPTWVDRLRGAPTSFIPTLFSNQTAAETTGVDLVGGFYTKQNQYISYAGSSYNEIGWAFRRAPGFFDVVCYTGTGANRTVSHNLGVAPELMIVKQRNTTRDWPVYASSLDSGKYLTLNSNAAENSGGTQVWNSAPTASTISLGTSTLVNESAGTYVAYLFASVAGVSKVGSYTGTGTTKQIDCGFTGGARFVLIKRYGFGITGDWYVWDSARGIVAGNDPYLLLNSTAAEVTGTDYVDTYSAGFEISSTAPAAINANGGTFIFLAIA
jgi:hypothetical protein